MPDRQLIPSTSTGALCVHTASKLMFLRFFRHSRHVYSHTWLGWTVWTALNLACVAAACILALAVPIFSDLIGIAASLFAAWYTYGLAGFFWLHDVYHLGGGKQELKRRWIGTIIAVLTILAGAFICVAGTYVSIKVSTTYNHLVRRTLSSHVNTVDCGRIQSAPSWQTVHLLGCSCSFASARERTTGRLRFARLYMLCSIL